MPIATDKLLRLLHADQPAEVRRAAVLVLGEVGAKDAAVAKAVAERLHDDDAALRLQAIQAAGKLKIDAALPALLERLREGGEGAAEAAESAAKLGAKGTRALQALMPKVAPGLRRYIASALAGSGGAAADAAAVAVLFDKDPGVVEAAASSLAGQVRTLTPAQRRSLTEQLLKLAGDTKTPLPSATEAAVVRLLTALDDPRAAPALWDRVLPPHGPDVRSAALQVLGKWVTAPDKDQLKRLFACATDRDFRVAAPALVMLQRLTVTDRALPEWLALLQAPDVAARQLALEKLGDRDTAEVADALMQQIRHPDRALRDGALARLAKLKHGQKALTKALLAAESADPAWVLARAIVPFAKEFPPDWREKVFAQICEHLEANDRRVDALLFLLREAEPAELRDRLEQRAVALRKKKDYATALHYLRLLTRDPAIGFGVRLELACCGLKLSSRELSAESRAADPCLGNFGHLLQQDEAALIQQIEKTKWLEPEELYYLGFHFAEQLGRARKFAADVLKLVGKRSPRSKVAQAAKSKLKSTGLD